MMAISELYYKLYDCEFELKNYSNALEFYKKYSETKDSIKSKEQFSLVNELEQKYNKVENEKVISDLTKEKEISSLRIKILIISIFLIVVLVGFIIFFLRQRSFRQKHALLETEQRLNRSRINPHFFFNSITTLQGIALKENDGKKIYTNLFTFSKLMRETLESTYSDLIPIKNEISFLMNYVELQKLNRNNKFTFEVKVSPDIDQDAVLIPAMIIQPFIENSIEHGLNKLENNQIGNIILEFNIHYNELVITIKDNGVGLNTTKEKKEDHTSRAMQITTDRLNLINNLHGTKARFTLETNVEGGTKAEIYLPLGLKDENPGN
ncbi:MAG: histidine kinase [Sphingobacteriaceae bacterium]|nr:histidine kinase [Sphingobacteriaceae bacterium]